MPWKRAKALPPPDNSLFEACFRIQKEASEAAGRHIPMVVENVRGAQKWVGRSRWNFGSFHLWGDVPALMPMTSGGIKAPGMNWSDQSKRGQDFTRLAGQHAIKQEGLKGYVPEGTKKLGKSGHPRILAQIVNKTGSKSKARKAASAAIAKIPLPLSQYIAAHFKPEGK